MCGSAGSVVVCRLLCQLNLGTCYGVPADAHMFCTRFRLFTLKVMSILRDNVAVLDKRCLEQILVCRNNWHRVLTR